MTGVVAVDLFCFSLATDRKPGPPARHCALIWLDFCKSTGGVAALATGRLQSMGKSHSLEVTMTFWRKNETEYAQMQRLIERNPGINPHKLAKELGVPALTCHRSQSAPQKNLKFFAQRTAAFPLAC